MKTQKPSLTEDSIFEIIVTDSSSMNQHCSVILWTEGIKKKKPKATH